MATMDGRLEKSIFYVTALSGVGFLLSGLISVGSLIYLTISANYRDLASIFDSFTNKAYEIDRLSIKVAGFFSIHAILLFLVIFCSIVGVYLLKTAGLISRSTIPERDRELLTTAIEKGNSGAITEYVRLASLNGMTGFFSRIGITGVTFALVLMSVIFTILGATMNQAIFLDLAKLTVGAIIGSFTVKQKD